MGKPVDNSRFLVEGENKKKFDLSTELSTTCGKHLSTEIGTYPHTCTQDIHTLSTRYQHPVDSRNGIEQPFGTFRPPTEHPFDPNPPKSNTRSPEHTFDRTHVRPGEGAPGLFDGPDPACLVLRYVFGVFCGFVLCG